MTLLGSDNLDGSKPFTIMAKEDVPGAIFVDFSPKGGPPNLLGVFDETDNSIKVRQSYMSLLNNDFFYHQLFKFNFSDISPRFYKLVARWQQMVEN